jgi:hypothetical protein
MLLDYFFWFHNMHFLWHLIHWHSYSQILMILDNLSISLRDGPNGFLTLTVYYN